MKNLLPSTTAMTRRRRDTDDPESVMAEPAPTEALPEAAAQSADGWPVEAASAGDFPTAGSEAAALPPVDDEPFVPKSRYVMGRSTKVLVCVLLVAAGVFAGSAVQKQIDAGDRAARSNFGNFQGPGAGTGAGTGNTTPGQGRRNGGNGTGGAGSGGAGTGNQPGTPAQGSGQ